MLYLTVASLAIAVQQSPPKFADSFYTGLQASMAINTGGYKQGSDKVCCAADAPQCKIQTQSLGSDTFEHTSKQMVHMNNARGSVVSNYQPAVKKMMGVVPGQQVNSTHKWACLAYCPLTDVFTSAIPSSTTDMKISDKGTAHITQPVSIGGNNATCEHFKWIERLAIIPFLQQDFYVDQSVAPPVPFYQHTVIEPFGQKQGVEESYYVGYQPYNTTSYFDVDMDPNKCKLAKQCSSNAAEDAADEAIKRMRSLSGMDAAEHLWGRSLYDVAAEHGKTYFTIETPHVHANPNVTFAGDYVTSELLVSLINQGGRPGEGQAPEDICCSTGAPQCQVQSQHLQRTRYADLTNQRERFEVGSETTINDFKLHKTYSVTGAPGSETCVEFCPIDPSDQMMAYSPWHSNDVVTDVGATTYAGKPAEHYRWSVKAFKVITMQTTDFYADLSDPKNAVPLFATTVLTPFGMPQIGANNITYSSWTPGPPPAAKFAVKGIDSCPQAKKCGSSAAQMHNFQTGLLHTFMRHHVVVEDSVRGLTSVW